MYAFSMNEGDVPCLECRRVMVDLAGYDRMQDVGQLSDGAIPYGIGPAVLGGAEMWILLDLVDSVFKYFEERIRRMRVRKLCKTVLPQFPLALVCPYCLFVIRRIDKQEHPYAAMMRSKQR